jgi:acyl-CoA thioester hydrolase
MNDPIALSQIFRLETTAEPSDIDELGHVSNVSYVRWVQDVAREHSASVGLTRDAYVQRTNGVFVVSRHEIDYIEPALEGDRIQLVTYITTWRAASSERYTRIERMADGALLARARTLWAFVRVSNGKPKRIPPEVATAFGIPPRPEIRAVL